MELLRICFLQSCTPPIILYPPVVAFSDALLALYFQPRFLAVKNLYVTARLFECRGKICQSDWLGSDGGLIKNYDRRLDEKNFYSVSFYQGERRDR